MTTPPLRQLLAPRLRDERRSLGHSAGLAVVGVVLGLARPWPLALSVDHVLTNPSPDGPTPQLLLVLAGIATVGLAVLAGLVERGSMAAGETAAERVGAGLRADLLDRAMHLSVRWHDRTHSGEVVSRITTDVGRVLDALVAVTAVLLPESLALVGALTVLVVVDAPTALVGLAAAPVLALLTTHQRRQTRAAQRVARSRAGELGASTTELLRNVRGVQAFDRHDLASATFSRHNQAVLDAETQAVLTEARWLPRAEVVLTVGAGLALVVGGSQVVAGEQSVGHLLVALAYLRELYAPVRSLTRLSALTAKAEASAERINEVLDAEDLVPDGTGRLPRSARPPAIDLSGVGFGHGPDRPVLAGLDLRVEPGETVCLVGPSGAGKSTLLDLVLRLHDVQEGCVLIGGVDVRQLRLSELRRHLAFVPQDPWLLDATLADNIAFGARDATLARVRQAAHDAFVDEFADRLPLGLATPLGEGGARLSGGQRRRVALARAAVSRAPVVLLDEPTASLDADAAARVMTAIAGTTRGRTTLVVTHDPHVLGLADRVITLPVARRAGHDLAGPQSGDRTTPTTSGGR